MEARQIADELSIRRLVARYADAVTRRDARAWSETWAEDGEWQVLGHAARGRPAMVALWQSLMANFPFAHQVVGSGLVELSGESATGRWSVTEYLKTGDGQGTLTLGVYDDDYRRVGGAWRFARRRFHALYTGPPDLSAEALRPSGSEEEST